VATRKNVETARDFRKAQGALKKRDIRASRQGVVTTMFPVSLPLEKKEGDKETQPNHGKPYQGPSPREKKAKQEPRSYEEKEN